MIDVEDLTKLEDVYKKAEMKYQYNMNCDNWSAMHKAEKALKYAREQYLKQGFDNGKN